MTIFKSESGRTALRLNDEITSIYCSCFRLESHLWHYIGDTEPVDPSIEPGELEDMFIEMVESLDKQEFDLSKSLSEMREDELR